MRVPRHPFLLGWLLPDSQPGWAVWRLCWRPPPGFLNTNWRSSFADSNLQWLGRITGCFVIPRVLVSRTTMLKVLSPSSGDLKCSARHLPPGRRERKHLTGLTLNQPKSRRVSRSSASNVSDLENGEGCPPAARCSRWTSSYVGHEVLKKEPLHSVQDFTLFGLFGSISRNFTSHPPALRTLDDGRQPRQDRQRDQT